MAREQWRLAAIGAANVFGYSRLIGRHESRLFANLRHHCVEFFDLAASDFGFAEEFAPAGRSASLKGLADVVELYGLLNGGGRAHELPD